MPINDNIYDTIVEIVLQLGAAHLCFCSDDKCNRETDTETECLGSKLTT